MRLLVVEQGNSNGGAGGGEEEEEEGPAINWDEVPRFDPGEYCLAYYERDHSWYTARVLAKSPSETEYTIEFRVRLCIWERDREWTRWV